MEIDISVLELLPAEAERLKPCNPKGTCSWSCSNSCGDSCEVTE
jgi:hypothetical protein